MPDKTQPSQPGVPPRPTADRLAMPRSRRLSTPCRSQRRGLTGVQFGLAWSLGALTTLTPLALPAATETDLDVVLIERTPKYDYDDAKNRPEPGDVVTFHGHVRHWGGAATPTLDRVSYTWSIDGVAVGSGALADFEPLAPPFALDYRGYPDPYSAAALRQPGNWPKDPGAYDPADPPTGLRVITLPWVWQEGAHTVDLWVDADETIPEASEHNNRRTDRTDAIAAGFWVEESTWRYFHQHQHLLGVGSNSWEDWAQRQMATQNTLYAAARWATIPDGVPTRVRIDRLIVVPDGLLPVNGGLASNHPDSSDKTVDLQWGFSHGLLDGSFYADHTTVSNDNPFHVEKSLLHELGHARYLIDSYGFDVHNTAGHHAVQIWEGDTYVAGSAYMPFLAFGEVLYYNRSGGVMTGPYGFQWSPYEAGALSLLGNARAVCGNMNAPCNIGAYLEDLPANNHLRSLDTGGWPRAGVAVQVYQAGSGPGWYGKTFDNLPDQSYSADAEGVVHLPRNPFNPGGAITHGYGRADGVAILRIAQDAQVWYRFLEVSDFNLAYWRGETQDAYYTLVLDGPNPVLPEGRFEVAYAAGSGGGEPALYDLSGRYESTVAGFGLEMNLEHDAKGTLAGTGRLHGTLAGGSAVDLPIALRGKCLGKGGQATVKLRFANAAAKSRAATKGSLDLAIADGQLAGTLAAKVADGLGGKEAIAAGVACELAAGMDGSHRFTVDLARDGKGKIVGTGTATLANGRQLPLTVKGSGTRGQAELTLVGNRTADPLLSNAQFTLNIATSAGGSAEVRWAKGKAFGQALAWP